MKIADNIEIMNLLCYYNICLINKNLTINFHSTIGLLLLTKPMVGVINAKKPLYCMQKEAAYESNKNRKIYCRV